MDRVVQPQDRTVTDEMLSLIMKCMTDLGLAECFMDEDGEWYFKTVCSCPDPVVPDYTLPQAIRASVRLIRDAVAR